MPKAIVGLGFDSDVACVLPFSANIADGFELERLMISPGEFGELGRRYPPSS
jgi:hypothetical protein